MLSSTDGNAETWQEGDDSQRPPRRLLKRSEAPQHRANNPYIMDGYLPPLSLRGCLQSLFYVHNETGNIVTHAVPLLFIVLLGPTWPSLWSLNEPLLSLAVLVVMAMPWAASTMYHIFMSHRGGKWVYRLLLGIDVVGICTAVCLGAMPHVYVSTLGLGKAAAAVAVLTYCHACLYSLIRAVKATNAWDSRTCFALPVLMVAACWVLRVSPWGEGQWEGGVFVPPMLTFFVLGGLAGATFVPERWAPGYVDLAGNSHQIMHLLVVAAQYCMFRGALTDLRWLLQRHSHLTDDQ